MKKNVRTLRNFLMIQIINKMMLNKSVKYVRNNIKYQNLKN